MLKNKIPTKFVIVFLFLILGGFGIFSYKENAKIDFVEWWNNIVFWKMNIKKHCYKTMEWIHKKMVGLMKIAANSKTKKGEKILHVVQESMLKNLKIVVF